MLDAVRATGPDVQKNREEARAIMKKLGYGPDKRLPLKVSTRNISIYKDPAVIFAGQLKEIWIDAEIDIIETSQWFAKIGRKAYSVGLNTTGNERRRSRPDTTSRHSPAESERNCHRLLQSRDRQAVPRSSRPRPYIEAAGRSCGRSTSSSPEDGARPVIMWNRFGHLLARPTSRATCSEDQQRLQRLQRFEDVGWTADPHSSPSSGEGREESLGTLVPAFRSFRSVISQIAFVACPLPTLPV